LAENSYGVLAIQFLMSVCYYFIICCEITKAKTTTLLTLLIVCKHAVYLLLCVIIHNCCRLLQRRELDTMQLELLHKEFLMLTPFHASRTVKMPDVTCKS